MSSLEAQSSAPPVFPCPYTAGGCPLFNTVQVELPKPPAASTSCAGGCAPSPNPNPSDPSLKLRPISPERVPSPTIRLPSIDLAATSVSVSASAREWSEYLEFGLQPPTPTPTAPTPAVGEPELAPLYVPLAQSQKRSASTPGLWDIEELVPAHAKKPRNVPPVTSLPDPFPYPLSRHPQQSFDTARSTGVAVPFDQSRASPSSSSEEGVANEVVTPFISKLSYLLDHAEYEPWIRWDASGTYILIAHTKPRLLEILARYFRHTTIASFVRQLNIYGFKRVSTGSLLSILDSTSLPQTVLVPHSTSPNSATHSPTNPSCPPLSSTSSTTTTTAGTEFESFSASDYSAFHNAKFFRSSSIPTSRDGGATGSGSSSSSSSSYRGVCRLGALKPITKERGPRVRSKKARADKAKKAEARDMQQDDEDDDQPDGTGGAKRQERA